MCIRDSLQPFGRLPPRVSLADEVDDAGIVLEPGTSVGVRATPPPVLKPVPQRLGLEYTTEEGGDESIRPVAEVGVGDVRVLNESPSSARWGVLVACRHQVEEAVPVGVGGKEREEERGAALGGKVSWSSCCLAYQYGLDPVMLAPYRHCLLYTSPSPRDATLSRMPSSA